MLNKTDLAAPLGVSVPTVTQWLGVLEATGEILVVPPFFENFGKRLVKPPKVHFVDSGLACHLLGLDTEAALHRSPFLGPLYEGFVASEGVKHQLNGGRRREIYYFRDQQGLEVDLVVPAGERRLVLIEAKALADADDPASLEDAETAERALLYVALTRAKKSAGVTAAGNDEQVSGVTRQSGAAAPPRSRLVPGLL